MRPATRQCLLALSIAAATLLGACSPSSDAPTAAPAAGPAGPGPTQADIDRFIAEGPEPTLRKIVPFDYLVHYRVMETTGMVEALGGEDRAVAALKALGEEYERKLRGAEADAARMIPAAFDGTGIDSGFVGMSVGAFGGLIAGGMVSSAVSRMSDAQLGELVREGPIQLGGKDGRFVMQFDESGAVDQTMEFDGKVSEGLTGKVKVKIHIDACPDPTGMLTVTMAVDSQMGVDGKPGVGGFVRSEFKLERFLDDDAHLIDDGGSTAEMTMTAGGNQGDRSQSFEARMGYGRGATGAHEDYSNERGFSIFHMDEVRHAASLAEQSFLYQNLVAEVMLRGIGTGGGPWESGRCVELKVASDPGKRKGIRPNTAFDIEAMPRARSDGAPTGGTVTATLDGGESLQPASGKVPADATYGYAGPAQKKEKASIAFEARSKRGVGRATLDFDTGGGAYRIKGGQNDFFANVVVCPLAGPFDIKSTAGIVMHMSGGEDGGSWTMSGKAAGATWSGGGSYTLKLGEDGSGWLEAQGTSTIGVPGGRFSDSVEPVFSVTPVDEACE